MAVEQPPRNDGSSRPPRNPRRPAKGTGAPAKQKLPRRRGLRPESGQPAAEPPEASRLALDPPDPELNPSFEPDAAAAVAGRISWYQPVINLSSQLIARITSRETVLVLEPPTSDGPAYPPRATTSFSAAVPQVLEPPTNEGPTGAPKKPGS